MIVKFLCILIQFNMMISHVILGDSSVTPVTTKDSPGGARSPCGK